MPRLEPHGSFPARLRALRRRQNIERCAIPQMTQPWAQRPQVSFASHKFGKTLQNDLHLSEPSALVKGSAKDRNDIAQKESRALEGAKARLPARLGAATQDCRLGVIRCPNPTNCQSTQVEMKSRQDVSAIFPNHFPTGEHNICFAPHRVSGAESALSVSVQIPRRSLPVVRF